ncbi:MAG: tRNA 4-thiouridine(8) synthase ThiI [Thermoplasmatales archaeon]|nr:tRNA 4-thiouridine(8) synthase ThiI [Thermoplasmatales archaeon]
MKFVSLISSGIDSPVATYLLSKKTENMILVHGDDRPFTDDRELENFISIARHLKKKISGSVKAFIVPHGNALSSDKKNCANRFTCVFCKRMLVRYAEKIAERENAVAIIMGDSLGQVASQTLQNLRVVEQAVSFPILRPLIGLDKEDVIRIAKNIGTYDISILPSDGCTAVPSKPATRARLEDVLTEEKKIDVNKIVDQAIKNAELISF